MTITDRQEVLPYLTNTVKTNLPPEVFQQTNILNLDWTKDSDDFTEAFDVVLGADIVYIEEVFEDLLKTLIKLSDTNTVILLSCRIRYDRDTKFLTRLNEFFDVHKVMYDKAKDVKLYKVTKNINK
jgi:predicted nicotinamide N-methyase